jgi:hypothetical protein
MLTLHLDAQELGTQFHSTEASRAYKRLSRRPNPTPEAVAEFLVQYRGAEAPEVIPQPGAGDLRGQYISNGQRFEYQLDQYGSSVNRVIKRDPISQEPKKEQRQEMPVWVLGRLAQAPAFDPGQIQRDIQSRADALIGLADLYESGKINADQLEKRAAKLVREIAILQSTLGAGGAERLTGRDRAKLDEWLRQQLYNGVGDNGKRYGIRHLVNDLRNGMSIAQLRNRLRKYARNSKQAFWLVFQNHAGPYGLRVMDPRAEHCQCCINEARKGVQFMSQIRLIGDCDCFDGCRCTILPLTLEQAVRRGLRV